MGRHPQRVITHVAQLLDNNLFAAGLDNTLDLLAALVQGFIGIFRHETLPRLRAIVQKSLMQFCNHQGYVNLTENSKLKIVIQSLPFALAFPYQTTNGSGSIE